MAKYKNGELNSKDRKQLKKILENLQENTPEKEAALQKAIAEDPDTWSFTGKRNFRGRPKGRTKQQVTVSLDIDLIEALKKPEKKGWQTRLNKAARDGLGI